MIIVYTLSLAEGGECITTLVCSLIFILLFNIIELFFSGSINYDLRKLSPFLTPELVGQLSICLKPEYRFTIPDYEVFEVLQSFLVVNIWLIVLVSSPLVWTCLSLVIPEMFNGVEAPLMRGEVERRVGSKPMKSLKEYVEIYKYGNWKKYFS